MRKMKLRASQRQKIRSKLRETHYLRPSSAAPDPMDILWKHGINAISGKKQYKDIDQRAESFIERLSGLSNKNALHASGALSADF